MDGLQNDAFNFEYSTMAKAQFLNFQSSFKENLLEILAAQGYYA